MASYRIVFVTRGLHDGGGIERMTSFVASELALRKHHVAVVALQKKGKPFFSLSPEVAIHYLTSRSGKGKVAQLRAFYTSFSPDLIIAVGTNRSHIHVPAAKGYRLASWEHFNTRFLSHPFHTYSRRLASKKGWIISLTQEDALVYRKRFKARQVVSIPNPVTIQPLLHSESEENVVLAVGRLKTQKGFDRLIKAWALVHPMHPTWSLKIVGSGSKEKALRRLVAQLHLERCIELVPHTPSITEQYASAAIFALSSRYEGFVLVLLEALASGLPAVAFDVPGGPRELLEDSEAGLLVEDGDINAYAEALSRLIANPELRYKMRENGLIKAQEYTPEKIMKKWEAFLDLAIQK